LVNLLSSKSGYRYSAIKVFGKKVYSYSVISKSIYVLHKIYIVKRRLCLRLCGGKICFASTLNRVWLTLKRRQSLRLSFQILKIVFYCLPFLQLIIRYNSALALASALHYTPGNRFQVMIQHTSKVAFRAFWIT
jgi:hypothetical protein